MALCTDTHGDQRDWITVPPHAGPTVLDYWTTGRAAKTAAEQDNRQWSPLIWAANHGNDALTRVLVGCGAADVYKNDDILAPKAMKKKQRPLHWAAFKGHLNVLWLLMAPPQSLSHHERDTTIYIVFKTCKREKMYETCTMCEI